MTLAFFDNDDAAHGVTTYSKNGEPQLMKRILVDSGANVLCIKLDVATNCPLPMVSCTTHIKIFGDNQGFCRCQDHELPHDLLQGH